MPREGRKVKMKKNELVVGHRVQIDRSGGQGRCWRDIPASEINADARMEIEGEIIDGKKATCDDMVAGNGQHYRW